MDEKGFSTVKLLQFLLQAILLMALIKESDSQDCNSILEDVSSLSYLSQNQYLIKKKTNLA